MEKNSMPEGLNTEMQNAVMQEERIMQELRELQNEERESRITSAVELLWTVIDGIQNGIYSPDAVGLERIANCLNGIVDLLIDR